MRWRIAAVALGVSLTVLMCLRPVADRDRPGAAIEPLEPASRPFPIATPERGRRCPPSNVAPSCMVPAGGYLLYQWMDAGHPLPDLRLPQTYTPR